MSQRVVEDEMRELAALYALDALDADERSAFERHLEEGCKECDAERRAFEETAAQLVLVVPQVAPPSSVREKLLNLVSAEAHAQTQSAPSQFAGLKDFLVVRKEDGKWMKTADAGVYVKLLFVDKERDTVTTLVRLDPGARISAHRHLGTEQCLILEGRMRSGETILSAGDFNCAMPESVHDEIYTEEGALLLIIASESYEVLAHSNQ